MCLPVRGVHCEIREIRDFTVHQVHCRRDATIERVQVEGGSGIEMTLDLAVHQRESANPKSGGLLATVRG
jgi:hypothetical protein